MQIANATNRLSAAAALNFICRTHAPEVTDRAIAWFNSEMEKVLCHVAGASVRSRFDEFAIRQSKLPISLGGLHLRDYSRIGAAAYYAAAVRAMPRQPDGLKAAFDSSVRDSHLPPSYCTSVVLAMRQISTKISAKSAKSLTSVLFTTFADVWSWCRVVLNTVRESEERAKLQKKITHELELSEWSALAERSETDRVRLESLTAHPPVSTPKWLSFDRDWLAE